MFLIKITLFSHKPKQLQKRIKYNNLFLKKKFGKKVSFVKQTPLKFKNKLFVVLKSPHVNKKSKEHFKYTIYKKSIIYKTSSFMFLYNFIILYIKITEIHKFLVNINIKVCL
jgi:ribosomal protein S10